MHSVLTDFHKDGQVKTFPQGVIIVDTWLHRESRELELNSKSMDNEACTILPAQDGGDSEVNMGK